MWANNFEKNKLFIENILIIVRIVHLLIIIHISHNSHVQVFFYIFWIKINHMFKL
jgi:hypothetical protein